MQTKINGDFISSKEMHALEVNAEYYGISLLQLMENAGCNIAQEIISRFPKEKEIAIFCGLGGNGGDGFVAARHLLDAGYRVTVILVGKARDINHEAALKNWLILEFLQDKVSLIEVKDSSTIPQTSADIVVDALLGTGTKGQLKPPIAQTVEYINSLDAFKIAVDVPTGIDSDTGEVLGTAVKANLTVTFHKEKTGLKKAKKYVGELTLAEIGLPKEMEHYTGPGDVYLAAPAKAAYAISSMSPDLITVKLEGANLNPGNMETLIPYLSLVDTVALGPGLGLSPETLEFVKLCVKEVEKAGKSLLLDADGLKAFAKFKRPLKVPLVLTPHASEYTILTGETLPENLNERALAVQKTAKKLGAVVLVKGKVDVICDAFRFKFNFTGNAGMTVGGTGDVLSGIVGGLMAQHIDPFESAVAGAFVNGAAGDFVAEEIGFHMVATDIIDWIPQVLDDPMSHLKVRKPSGR